ncbi:G patch domain-containing protein 4 [Pseudophryne corroboree]|uniref:G patch domain-containing protein 4 n=1 Tax=Pseudophryne corroboree TaxID=495146 RepID=UPI003081613B
MASPSKVKSRGMTFAVEHLQRHGWTEGKGLGKREDGISEAIKVKVKSDAAGVGHDSAEQFTFHWWDHVFNKTASSISVEPDQDGVQVRRLTEGNTTVSNKKPRKALTNSNMLYGRFIKSATLMSGGEQPVEEVSSPNRSDSSEDEDAKLDLSSATKVTDEDLIKICGGRTAHKGARHGLTMSAKLSRIEEQERAFLEKYGKKEPSKSGTELNTRTQYSGAGFKKKKKLEVTEIVKDQDISSDICLPKKKKKRKTADSVEAVEEVFSGHNEEHVPSTEVENITSKKKKKRRKVVDCEEVMEKKEIVIEQRKERSRIKEAEELKPAKKKKKRETVEQELEEDQVELNGHRDNSQSREEEHVKPEKKKKRKTKEEKEDEDNQDQNTEEEGRKFRKKKKWKRKDHEEEPEGQAPPAEEEDDKIRKKKTKHNHKERHAAPQGAAQVMESTELCITYKRKNKPE